MRTIDEVMVQNGRIGHHFFESATMRFFNSKVESELIGERFFITSERMELTKAYPAEFTIREAKPNGEVDTVGEFQGYISRAGAVREIKLILEGESDNFKVCGSCQKVYPTIPENEAYSWHNLCDCKQTPQTSFAEHIIERCKFGVGGWEFFADDSGRTAYGVSSCSISRNTSDYVFMAVEFTYEPSKNELRKQFEKNPSDQVFINEVYRSDRMTYSQSRGQLPVECI